MYLKLFGLLEQVSWRFPYQPEIIDLVEWE